jgi:superfamily II DNA or RNA helicase
MSQSQKTLEFLQKLKDIGHWNEDYDYSEVDYVDNTTKVIVFDKKYNSKHLIAPSKLILRNTLCGIRNVVDIKDYVIKQYIEVHGNIYDYSLLKYNGENYKVKIICKKHGVFEQKSNAHKNGSKCPECVGGIKKDNTESIIRKFKKIHGDIYDYSLVDYINSKNNIKIKCKNHGVFLQTTNSHLNGSNCPKCSGNFKFDSDEIKNEFKKIHGNKYDYSKVNYFNSKTPVVIICKKHGEFLQTPSSHKKGKNCPKCVGGTKEDREKTISDFKIVHGNKYDYSMVENPSSHEDIYIICKIHGEFSQRVSHHKNGSGCPICNKGWGKKNIINFINNIRNEDVLNMDPVELNMLIAQGKLPKEFEELVFTLEGTKENSLKTLKENLGIDDSHELNELELENLSDKLESMTISSYDDEINDALVAIETLSDEEFQFSKQEERKRQGLPSISNDDILVLDKELINTCDDEAVEFFIQYKLKRVWNEVINDKRDVKDIKDLNGGKNSSRLRDLFLSEYKKVVDYIPPTGYNFKRNGEIAFPNMMQKLTVQRVIDYKRYGNWSGTGAGKTISFIIASREVNSRLTIVICINSTVSQLEEDILDVYPDSKIFTHFRKGQKFNRDNYNYLLLNYEKFQQGYTEEIFQDLNENNLIDFIVLDEVHNAKQRDKDESIRRGALMRLIGRSAEMNPNFHLLGMSATPVINNLIEAKSLLQLITGKDYEDISTRGTITNALKIFNQLLINGIRYIPKYDIVLKELTAENTPALNIDGTKLTEKLKDNDNKDYLGLEKILLESKLEVLEEFLKPKTIIYTYFTDNDKIPKRIAKYVKSKGYSCGLYIGEQSTEDREHCKTSFVKGDVDILIASRIIGTGVDGLQNVCNRMILLTLPWTDSEYTQLKGRIYRQGSKFGDVEIVIPQVFVDLDDKRWSWDKQRLQLIREKRTLADAAVDGIIPSKHIPSRERLCSDSLQALKIWKDRVSEGKITTIVRNDLVLPLRPEILEYLKPSLGDFSEMNKSWSVSRSENTKNRLIKDPSEWYYYHSLYAEKRKEWSEIPYVEIAKKIKERPEWIVADMGCGENLLSKELTNQVHAFDYIAIDKNVIACDMSSVPLNSQEVDAVVFCLSLMGSNYLDYLKEAFRIIKPYGNLFICEPKKKIDNRIEDFKKDIESVGFKIIEVNSHSSKFIYFQGIKL